ncbi:nitrate- and nitrite sensing domain-containing protein, partial [Streptomyces sp. NPDC059900]
MQGRFKRDGSSAAAEPERGGTDRGSSAQHAQNPGQAPGDGGPSAVRGPGGGTSLPTATAPAGGTTGTAKSPTGPGSRIALRNWRISTRLVSLLALPVITATSLGALRINESMDEIQQLNNMKMLTDMTKRATELASALQEERDRSAGPLAHGAKSSDYVVKGSRQKTDRAYNRFLQETQELDNTDGDKGLSGVRANTVEITQQLQKISDVRKNAYGDQNSTSQTVDAYSQLIDQLLSLSSDMAQATSNPDMIQRTRALTAFSSAKEYASVQRAIIAASLPAGDSTFGKISETDRRYGFAALDKEGSELQAFKGIYAGNADELTKPIDGGNSSIKGADSYAKRVLEQEGGIKLQDKRSYKDWVDADTTKIDAMSKIELTLLNEMEQNARELRNESEQAAILNGALILLVLGVSLVGAFVVARSMIRSLRRLQDTATKVAQDRLPELVKQLSEADPQDVDTSVESVGVHSRDEIGQVAAAFDDVHREAVRLAAEQALLRGNVNAMFTNLSRRSQGLIQRQLSLISELESREADPDQLSSLFKLDHLATRMRRNGENLLVLAGEEPGRRWTRPVPLVDVLRAAASEVEQYERIELSAVPTTEVAGRVVNDLVHLLAELLENATSFSSPQTKVKVTGHALPDGRVLIEIHDTGIGLSPEDLAAINERLASPPTVDVSVSRRMGLFVVGRLSQRHGIRIQLRPSDSGGTTALVMLPIDVAQGGKKAPNKPGTPGPGQSGGPVAAQASAGAAAARRGVGAGSGAPGSAPAGSAGRLGAGPPRGQVTGSGPRAALPSRDAGPRTGSPSAPAGPSGQQPSRQGPPGFGAGAPGSSGGSLFEGGQGSGRGQSSAPQPPVPQQRTNPVPPAGPANPSNPANPSANNAGDQGRRPQLPPRGGPRAELPGGNPQPRVPSWSDENAQPQVSREPFDTPRGHEEPESTGQFPQHSPADAGIQGPGSTAEFARPDFNGPPPGTGAPQHTGQQGPGQGGQQGTGQFVRPDVFGRQGGQGNQGGLGNQGGQGNQDASSGTGQFQRPGTSAPGYNSEPAGRGQGPGQGQSQGGRLGIPPVPPQASQPQQPQQPAQPEGLPPAGPGDGRTPLFDTLETNWFQQQQQQGYQAPQGGDRSPEQQQPQRPQPSSPLPSRPRAQEPQTPAAPRRPAQAPAPASNGTGGGNNINGVTHGSAANWRTSPN